MIQHTIVVENKLGLHARAAAKLVHLTSRYRSEIVLAREGCPQTIDCKSILGVLMLAASQGTRLVISIQGADEVAAGAAIGQLFAAKFGEEI
jgi:phosphocarrier protein